KVREAANRAKCQNNLKQLGTALHSYDSALRHLPVSVSPWAEGPRPAANLTGRGWILQLLPYVEQEALFAQFEPSRVGNFFDGNGLKTPACRDAMKTQLPLLHCPSDPSVRLNSTAQYQWTGIEVALTSYKGVIGDTQMGGAASIHTGSLPDRHN